MFVAGKVEETPRPLRDVILVSYEILHKKGPFAAQKFNPKEAYEQQKELILLGEKLVLATLGFDLNLHHPYKPLVDAIKRFKVAKNALAKVAWNFVNDGLRTSLCLQYKPQHIAAGAIFLAAKFIKVKLPSDGEKVWWREFDVTPRQLEDVSNQLLELYEQNHNPTSAVCESLAYVNNAVKKNDLMGREIDNGMEAAVEDEKKRTGWPNPLHRLEHYHSPASMRTKPKEEDGELSSIDDHDCSSRKLQCCDVEISGTTTKRKPDEVWPNQSGREHKRFQVSFR